MFVRCGDCGGGCLDAAFFFFLFLVLEVDGEVHGRCLSFQLMKGCGIVFVG